MSYMDITAGRHIAKAVRARLGESSKQGTPMIEVEFEINDTNDKLRWQGYLTEKTLEKTLETMALLEWNDDETFGEGSINTQKDIALVVELEVGEDGKERPKIRWVNDVNRAGGKFEGVDPKVIASKLGGVNLKAEMAAARARLGTSKQTSTNKVEIPF